MCCLFFYLFMFILCCACESFRLSFVVISFTLNTHELKHQVDTKHDTKKHKWLDGVIHKYLNVDSEWSWALRSKKKFENFFQIPHNEIHKIMKINEVHIIFFVMTSQYNVITRSYFIKRTKNCKSKLLTFNISFKKPSCTAKNNNILFKILITRNNKKKIISNEHVLFPFHTGYLL